MGQKVHPLGLRLGINKTWDSRWFAQRNYRELLQEDLKIRKHIRKALKGASVAKVEIERKANTVTVAIHAAKPGVIIGRGGQGVEQLRKDLRRFVSREIHVNVHEVRNPDLEASLVAENVGLQLERRVAFRRAIRQAITRTMRAGAQGIRILCSGRLAGSELARKEGAKEGKIPLHTLRADISYGFTEGKTTYGNVGIKVWIYRGDVLPGKAASASGAGASSRELEAVRPRTGPAAVAGGGFSRGS